MPYKDPETRRLKQRAYSKRHYEANKETIIEKTTSYRDWETKRSGLRTKKRLVVSSVGITTTQRL